MSKVIVSGGTLDTGAQADIEIVDGVITAVGEVADDPSARVLDASGDIVLSGLVDLHTHLRQPGGEQAETVLSGSRSAAAGGYTCVHAMANTQPVADTAGVVDQVQLLGQQAGYVDVRPVGAVTKGLGGEQLAALGAMADSRAAVRVFSDDGKCVSDSLVMRRALEYIKAFDGVIAQHAQDPKLTEHAQMNEGELSTRLGLTGWPAVAEEAIIARDILLADHVGSRLHVCHLSTKGSVELLRWAKSRGMNVTAEVTPHHLLLSEQLATSYDPRFKVNPPLRSAEDIQAVRAGVADGTIDIVGTDHAPHAAEAKDCDWVAGAFGMIGLETALPIVYETLVEPGLIGWQDVTRVLSTKPAEIGQVATQGRPLAVGEPANITVFDPDCQWQVTKDEIVSASTNSPYLGRTFSGRTKHTIYAGTPTVVDYAVQELA